MVDLRVHLEVIWSTMSLAASISAPETISSSVFSVGWASTPSNEQIAFSEKDPRSCWTCSTLPFTTTMCWCMRMQQAARLPPLHHVTSMPTKAKIIFMAGLESLDFKLCSGNE